MLRNQETKAEVITAFPGTEDEQDFYKLGNGVYNWEYNAILVKANRPVDDDEMLQLAQLVGYAHSVLCGEGFSWPERVSGDAFIMGTDSTKNRNSAFDEFLDPLNDVIAEGTRLRTTNRSGPGTKGTRKTEGMKNTTVEIYMDQVCSFNS